ncbi:MULTISPECIES: Uma2 family endonuclease [Parafrankia]|uniref:Putative restriction endonuclease domain-containing protein n=1 Tax=Parafrankia soli TaxID=2599596 RepID=A0A1S1Q4M7_9ACTN|nr:MULTISPECIES: Uma2 family endonuclease [Parafrankia]ABW09641.1 protein of unknown function DUF820 [Frankia sp. EAN1pec]CAI7980461.1 Uma2 domain-containing protein [Frankia sp. Hr75.2]OHV28062.1 hypothetical protein BBK14_18140 [Parafrankia soli]TCJ35273.1 Uma2 family endonuclease [Parafrankia sp. BMG5.11]SQE00432.1 conserved hypothetical protein [Parafrankia sp. Ea1.12]
MSTVVQAPTPLRSHRPTLTLPAPPVSVADLDATALEDARVEVLDGLCVTRPWPTPLRARVTDRLRALLAQAATSGAQVFTGVQVELSPRCLLVPDVAVVAVGDPDRRRITETPFGVVEVADASTRRYDRTLKLDVYREHGVPVCWLVDPDSATIEAFELVGRDYVPAGIVCGDEELSVLRPFPVTVTPAELIDPPDD